MSDQVYYQLQELLDSMPSGFPKTEQEIEIKILKKIFTEEEAALMPHLRLKWEAAAAVAERTGDDPKELEAKLWDMHNRGEIAAVDLGDVKLFKLMPYIIGIYEFQLNRMDDEFVHLAEDYMRVAYAPVIGEHNPSFMRVLSIEEDVPDESTIEPYESLKWHIENAKAWAVGDCICKKEKTMLGEGCDNPQEVCISIAPMENFFDNYFWGRPISKDEAFKVLDMAEEAGLVHMTQNTKKGQYIICNCCECCCGMLRAFNELNKLNAVTVSRFEARVDEDLCTACGVCLDRCQVKAIDLEDTADINERCIGCGLCVSTCPAEAITMVEREDAPEIPESEKEWMIKREAARNGDSSYKKLLK